LEDETVYSLKKSVKSGNLVAKAALDQYNRG